MTKNTESDVHSRLYTRIKDYIQNNETKFKNVYTEYTTDEGRADIFVENPLEESLIVEAKAPEKYLLKREHIIQARDYAESLGYSTFSLVNEDDFFLFDYNDEVEVGEISFYHLNLRKFSSLSEAVPKILDAVRYLHHKNRLPSQGNKDKIIALLRSFHSSIYPTYEEIASQKYGKNRKFTNLVDKWARKNNHSNKDKNVQIEILSKQFTYSLAIKILFYRILRYNNIGREHGEPLEELGSGVADVAIRTHINQQFESVVKNINYEPIFDEGDSVFKKFPTNKRAQRAIKELLDNFSNLNITDVEEDLIGQLYEELIPEDERKRLGQFYTPPNIANTIVRWSIPDDMNEIPRVLDPACGSGTFPVEIYKKIEDNYEAAHRDYIENLTVVDVNRFPLRLTTLNIAGRNIKQPTKHVDSYNTSFFDLPEPEDKGKYDAVVGNPPYIYSDDLYPDTEHFREHLKEYSPEGNKRPAYYNGVKRFRKSTDAFVYFVTNSLRYLKDGGRLGFIIPTKWLSSKYGIPFQQFLFDNVKIDSIVSFSNRVFDDALVNTCMLLLEKCDNKEQREQNVTDFIHIKKEMSPDDMIDTIEYEADVTDDNYKFESWEGFTTVSMKQRRLEERKGKLVHYLGAPKQIIDLIESNDFQTLSDFADITNGTNTGVAGYFYIDEEDVDDWGIDKRFLTPAIKSIRGTDSYVVSQEDVETYLLDTREFIEKHDIENSDEAKRLLSEKGYGNLLRYIEFGENKGYHEKSKPVKRDIWFNITETTNNPRILHPVFYSKRKLTVVNKDRLVPSHAIQCVDVDDDVYRRVYAITNSYIYKILSEFFGRAEGGGALQLRTYEVKNMPFPDVHNFSSDEIKRLQESYRNIKEGEYEGVADKVIIDKFNLDFDIEDLKTIHSNIVESRVEGAEKTEPLVRTVEDIGEDVTPFNKR
jgi:type I restriction-modification system DNA methylase subunit